MEDRVCDSALSLLVFLAWKRKTSGSTVGHSCNICFACNKLEISDLPEGNWPRQMDHPNHGEEENYQPWGMCMTPLTAGSFSFSWGITEVRMGGGGTTKRAEGISMDLHLKL